MEVREDAVPVITTDASNLAETKLGDEPVDLPVAIYSRSTGSTSPISTLTTESGVQTDDSGELAVMGATPALLSVTIDGIPSGGCRVFGPGERDVSLLQLHRGDSRFRVEQQR